jgi:FlaA1/EpsC-like NDP-sugar epimerase
MPPEMHWAVVMVLSWITVGLGALIWAFKEAFFIKKIDPSSKAVVLIGVSLLCMVGQVALYFMMVGATSAESLSTISMVILVLNLVIFVVALMAIFGMRSSMIRYYNSVENIGLKLSGVMTFFFNILYFQYHFSRIANWKKTGQLG